MTARVVLAALAASTTVASGNIASLGNITLKSKEASSEAASEEASSEAESEEASSEAESEEAVSIDTDEYYFGKIDVPYADFYYGEINKVAPEALEDGEEGQYDAEDKVTAAGLREEGIYDAVTSATNAKSQRFEKSYFEQTDDGTNILGPSGVNVAISKALYDDVKSAIEAGTECSNPLVDFVSALDEVSEEVPAEYKVINSDGTLSQTIGTTTEAENVEVSFSTVSTWGNYQIDFDGLEIESADIQGALIETSDGSIYGLEHLDNLWLRANEIAFAVEEMTEPHGNVPSYQRFADMQGKTITKVTYMLADKDDISIETDLYCKELLPDEYSITTDEKVTYQADGTDVNITYTTPDDSSYEVESVAAGRSSVEPDTYSVDGTVLTLGSDLKPGSYTVTFSDDKYASKKASFLVESGLEEGSITIEDNAIAVAENEQGITAEDYIAQVSGVTVNGEPVSAKGIASIIFNEDGTINLDAEIEGDNGNTKVFDGADSYELELEATGYPTVTGTVSAQ